jgi:hypothetical protein
MPRKTRRLYRVSYATEQEWCTGHLHLRIVYRNPLVGTGEASLQCVFEYVQLKRFFE